MSPVNDNRSTFGFTRKRPFDRDKNRWERSSSSSIKRPKLYEACDFSRRVDIVFPRGFQAKTRDMEGPPFAKMNPKHDFSRKGNASHSRNFSGNRFHNPSRDFSRKYDDVFPRFQNPNFDCTRNSEGVSPRFQARRDESPKEGPPVKLNPTRDFSSCSDFASPRFEARSREIPEKGPALKLNPTGHLKRKCDSITPRSQVRTSENSKKETIAKVNQERDFLKKCDSVSPRFQARPSENPKEGSVAKVNSPRDFSRKCEAVSPHSQAKNSENPKEGPIGKMNPTLDFLRKGEAASPRVELKASGNSQEGPIVKINPSIDSSRKCVDVSIQVQAKNSENPSKVKPSEVLVPSVGNSESTKSMMSRDSFKRRKVDAVRQFPKHCGALAPRVKANACETPGEIRPSEVIMPSVVNSESTKSMVSRDNFKRRKVDAVRQFPKHCGVLAPRVACETPGEIQPSEAIMPSVVNSESTKSMGSRDNFKRRKVDAVRQFPKHCGALAPRVTIRRGVDNLVVVTEDTFKSSENSSSSVVKPDGTKSKVVNDNIEAIIPGLNADDVVKVSNKLKVDDVEEVPNESNFDEEEVLNEPISSNASEKFAPAESVDSSDIFQRLSPTCVHVGKYPFRKNEFSAIQDYSPKCGMVNHAFDLKDDVAPIGKQIQCGDSSERNEEDGCKVQWESTHQLNVDVSSEYGEEENRNEMGNSPIYPSAISLSPFEEHHEEALSEDDDDMVNAKYLNDSDLFPNQDKVNVLGLISVDTSSECEDEDRNEIGNSSIYPSGKEFSPFEEHDEEACSEDDCYIIDAKYIYNSDLLPNQNKVEAPRLSSLNKRPRVPFVDADKGKHKCFSNDLGRGSFGDLETVRKRKQAMEVLDSYRQILAKLFEDYKTPELDGKGKVSKQIHIEAAMLLKKEKQWVNTEQVLGHVPGVEVGDRFRFRAGLVCIGLHRQFQGGIDYMRKDGKILATSIVDSGRYANGAEFSDVLRYCGQGGNPAVGKDKQPQDQKLVRGNLALKNSMDAKTPVRVIRKTMKSDFTYFYDGIYVVTKVTQERSSYGKLIYMFELNRMISGEANVTKVGKLPFSVDDISHGKEKVPICAVNTVDDEDFPSFNYITNMTYPESCYRRVLGCDCTDGCSDSKKCRCVIKNGGEVPFNDDGAIIIRPKFKPSIYECGSSCKCPPSCKNRVSQYGIRYQLEVFKTESRGWGLRSRNYIPAGSFICEYVGELLQDHEAEKRTRNDEYLFDIGNNGYTIDVANYGNVGRFINHSCSPNLYAQNVLYDHDNKRMAHVMFFAVNGIFPLQELTCDYNYKVDQVRDGNGNIKKKACHCGSPRCSGRMY